MEGFKIGDVVRLKSGGPNMTVTSQENNGDLVCKWLDSGGKLSMHSFPAAALDNAEKEDENNGSANQEWRRTEFRR
jgi:uncharacterized protein YodC (DUF2158 family)